jgi:hypothetical protein
MSYKEKERIKAEALRDELLHDSGMGVFKGKERAFVLQNPELNLQYRIRNKAIRYFKKYNIQWWGGSLTGHLLSSQVSCVNHLFFLRNEKVLALRFLQNLNPDFVDVCEIDAGYIGFEVTGNGNYLGEGTATRGANCTSIDAAMIGQLNNGKKVLVFIEWKYTELYAKECKADGDSGDTRKKRYNHLISNPDSPISIPSSKIDNLYYEPFYQIMRQTLLAWQMVKHNDYGVEDWMHYEVVPENNIELRYKVHSPDFLQSSVEDAWKSVLKVGEKYQMISPQKLLKPFIFDNESTELSRSIVNYLNKRYW